MKPHFVLDLLNEFNFRAKDNLEEQVRQISPNEWYEVIRELYDWYEVNQDQLLGPTQANEPFNIYIPSAVYDNLYSAPQHYLMADTVFVDDILVNSADMLDMALNDFPLDEDFYEVNPGLDTAAKDMVKR